MTRQKPPDPTILTADADRRRIALALYPLRRAASRIAADCERMLDSLHDSDRKIWRDVIGDALVSSRHLLGVVMQSGDPSDATHVTQRVATLGARVGEPQRRIVDAMTRLLQFVPVNPEEELLLQDARSIRDMAADLFTFGARDDPAIASCESRRTEPGARAAPASGRIRVLVAEDESAVRQVLQRHLTRLGYEVVEAEDGRVALEIARRETFDLILTDINMPHLDGMALLKELKNAERTRDIPVIVISSQDDLSSVVTCIEHGAEDHISKPYQPLLLRARVRASLDRKFMRDLERDYLRRVAELTAAAEAVERGRFVTGSLDTLAAQSDALGRLARVFDRMVSGFKSREERLHRRLTELRREMGDAGARSGATATISEESPFASGEILAARYEILGQLGKGGMGMVYHAKDLELGEEVAVKVVRRDLVKADPTIVDRLKSEIRLTRRISHRNVVRAHDLGEWRGTYFISMEYVKGITVEQLIDRRGRLTVESTLAIGTQLAEALAVAHELQIIHRDIKPANLLVDPDGVLKVMDFGIARLMERGDNLTLGGFIVGTPQYMAPEQLMGGSVDGRTDLFAVGVVLYECLAGRPPFIADSPTAIHAQILDGNFLRLGELVPGVPPALEALIYQQLRFHQRDRIGSARDLANKLSETEHGVRREPASLLDQIDLQIVDQVLE